MCDTSDDLSADAMIAATARIHGMVVVTRNVKDFASFDVRSSIRFRGDRLKEYNPYSSFRP